MSVLRGGARDLHRALVVFFGAPTDGSAAAVFRIAFALLALVTTAGVALNVDRWFTDTGIMPSRTGNLAWSLFRLAPAATWPAWMHVGLLGAGSLMMLVGLWPRLGAFAIFVAHTSLQHRTPQILNSGDRLFAIVAFLAVFVPLARRWSVHAWWRRRRGIVAPLAPSWGLRLLQIQIAYVYANTAMAKLMSPRWRSGRMLYDVLASPVFAEWPTHLGQPVIIALMTWGTLVFEVAFPLLVWFRKTRYPVLFAGVAFHLGIDVLMIIPMFSWIMIASYTVFLDDDVVRRIAARLRLGGQEGLRGEESLGGQEGLRGEESLRGEETPRHA